MTPLFLGIDTSNYTTSAALAGSDGRIFLNCRIPLPVKEGERGLRQSDAVFHHVKNLPEAARAVGDALNSAEDGTLLAAGVSSVPRDAEGSYMPCFLSGVSAAEMAANVRGIPLYRFSHQAGHVMAAVGSVSAEEGDFRSALDRWLNGPFLAFHVSGGTTDLLLVRPDEEKIFSVERIGGSKDINGGQAVDRTGVRMGLSFPAGRAMDEAALAYGGKIPKAKISVDGASPGSRFRLHPRFSRPHPRRDGRKRPPGIRGSARALRRRGHELRLCPADPLSARTVCRCGVFLRQRGGDRAPYSRTIPEAA